MYCSCVQFSPCPCGSAVYPRFWTCSSYVMVLHLLLPEPESLQFFSYTSCIRNTTLECRMNLDLTLYRLGVLISHRKLPLSPHLPGPWKDKKLPCGFPGLLGSHFQLCAAHRPTVFPSVSMGMLSSSLSPICRWSLCPLEPVGEDRSLSAWWTTLLEAEYLPISKRCLSDHYCRDCIVSVW